MPATAAHQPDAESEHCLAPVVDLSSRRGGGKAAPVEMAPDATESELQAQASRHWKNVFAAAGVDLRRPEAVQAVVLAARELERLVNGMLMIREGGEGLPANPAAGVDFTSAVEITGLLRDLARTVQSAHPAAESE